MRKFASLLTAVALATGVLATAATPASASTATAGRISAQPTVASSVTYKVNDLKCFSNAIQFTAKQQENGVSGVTQFRQLVREQEFTNHGWVFITGTGKATSNPFPNDSRSFFYTRVWKTTHAADGASYRARWQGLYYSGSRVIFRTPFVYATCA